LRNNGGGLLNSAIDIAELFLDKNSLVATTKDRNNKVTEEYRTHKDPLASTATPIFILINPHTASSAEILAGALKVHSEKLAQQSAGKKQNKLLVFIVGTHSFGKGSVQELIPIGNDCALKLTTALYYLPNDVTVQGVGIEPDIKIEQKLPPTEQMQWVNTFYGKESALKNSIKTDNKEDKKQEHKKKHHNKKLDSKKSIQDKRKEILAQDSQIRDTITCINILNAHPWKNRTDAIKIIKSIFITDGDLTLEEIEA
jgi:carboxyl-terminal processing protease